MTREVIFTEFAKRDLYEIGTWLSQRSPSGAMAWYQAMDDAIASIAQNPEFSSLLDECDEFDIELRQRHFKTRRGGKYRLVFQIEDQQICILRIRAPGQKPLRPGDVG